MLVECLTSARACVPSSFVELVHGESPRLIWCLASIYIVVSYRCFSCVVENLVMVVVMVVTTIFESRWRS